MDKRPWTTGALIRTIRLEKGLTQRQLAELAGAGYRERDIQHMESGRRGLIRPQQLGRLFHAMQTDLSVLDTAAPQEALASPHIAESSGVVPESLLNLSLARERLRNAVTQSQIAYQRTSELLSISSQLLQPPAPAGASAPIEAALCGMA